MEWLFSPEIWLALLTLTALEIVLGVDNIIFIAILAGKLPESQQPLARRIGLLLAMFSRIALLFSLSLIMRLTNPWFTFFSHDISGRDVILIGGGLFLIFKATLEIHDKLEGSEEGLSARKVYASFVNVVVQIMILDIIFSLDSVITAIGLVNQIPVMATAIIIAVIFMMIFVGKISTFIDDHPTIKVLALSFLLLVGMALIGEGFGLHIPKGYIYFAMAFSVFVEMLNLRVRTVQGKAVKLRQTASQELKKQGQQKDQE